MKVYKKLTEIIQKYPRPAVALGVFDGVHIGHASIIRRAVELAKANNGTSMVFTFSNHPLSVLNPEREPLAIGSKALRRKIVESLGVDVMIELAFTKEFSRITPEDFLMLLEEKISPEYVVTGQNFTFGKFGKGNGRMLIREGINYGFKAEICPTITADKKTVSSTRIRELIVQGDLQSVNELLGRPFIYVAKVVHGDKRGRKLGFPTANLDIGERRAMLPNGAYAVAVNFDNKKYCGIANIGDNPTFNVDKRRIEVYINDFSGNLYGKDIEVSFIQKLREEQKFNSIEELKMQLRQDLKRTITIFNESGGRNGTN